MLLYERLLKYKVTKQNQYITFAKLIKLTLAFEACDCLSEALKVCYKESKSAIRDDLRFSLDKFNELVVIVRDEESKALSNNWFIKWTINSLIEAVAQIENRHFKPTPLAR